MPYNGAARPRDGLDGAVCSPQKWNSCGRRGDDFLLVCPGDRVGQLQEIRRDLTQCKRLKLGQITSSSGVRLPPPTQSQLGREFVTS